MRSVIQYIRRYKWWALCGVAALLMLCGIVGVRLWMGCQRVSASEIARVTPSRLYYDASGNLISVSRGSDYRWHLPISLSEIPETMVEDVIAVEDMRFFEHDGVDYRSAIRAGWQMLTFRRVVSGASTITMQVVNQYCGRGRGIFYKLRQMGMAWNWEKEHSKQQILEDYFNLLPYGGTIYGVEAAAQFYFGRSAKELNRGEQLLLAGLPQGPSWYRPDRHPERALRRRDVVLVMLQRAGRMTTAEAAEVQRQPLRYRDFSVPAWPHSPETEFLDVVTQKHPGRREYRTTLLPSLQEVLRGALKAGIRSVTGVRDGAAVVIETPTGKVRGMVGSLDTGDPSTAAVNAALSWRSPGSALKPFIYGEAINGGIITANTILDDSPLNLRDYRPDNYDRTFRGKVRAETALAESLNTPVVRLLARLTTPRILKRLEPLKLFPPSLQGDPEEIAKRVGLSFAIGGLESQLLALTGAYSALGEYRLPQWLEDESPAEEYERYWLPGTTMMLHKMLKRPMPGTDGRLLCAWKTGTSNGHRDAWCFAVTPQWTVGVWLGNKDGAAAQALVGGELAAPVAGAVMQYLHRGAPALWVESPPELASAMLCCESGLAQSAGCQRSEPGAVVADIPLARCTTCRVTTLRDTRPAVQIISPSPGTFRAGARGVMRVPLRTKPSKSSHLYLNGQYLGVHRPGEILEFKPGAWQLLVWQGDESRAATVNFTVK